MAQDDRPSGIRVVFDEAQWTQDGAGPDPGGVRGRGGLPRGDVALASAPDDVADAIALQDFELLDEIALTPNDTVVRGAVIVPPTLEVPLAADESAVVLLARDDVYEWVLPEATPANRLRNGPSTTGRTLVFSLPPGPVAPGGSSAVRGLGDSIRGALRAWVLRFAARALTPVAIGFLERKVETRLVDMRAPDPLEWSTAAAQDVVVSAPRVLLFVHGTFSSTLGAYHALTIGEAGRVFLEWARTRYDEILGYDHATLSVDPVVNAQDLLARLAARYGDAAPIVDIVAHSRGGLVARALVEMVAPSAVWAPRFDRLVMVGCTNAGTHLAEPANWKRFVDFYTNLGAHAVRLVAGSLGRPAVAAILDGVIRSVGALVKYLAVNAVEEGAVPGLAAMQPGSPLLVELNRTNPGQRGPGDSMYFVVQAEFEAALEADDVRGLPRALAMWLGDRLADQLLGVANDLIVDTTSMATIDPDVGGFVKDTLDFGRTGAVHHVSYFTRDETAAAILRWLGGDAQIPSRSARPHASFRGGKKRAMPAPAMQPGVIPANVDLPAAAVGEPDAAGGDEALPPRARLECRAEMPAQIGVAQPFELLVILSREAIAAAAVGVAAASAAVDGNPDAPLLVSVSPRSNVELDNPAFEEVPFPEPGVPRELFFRGRALVEGPAVLWVYVRQGRSVLAKLTVEGRVVAATESASGGTTHARADIDDTTAITIEAPYTLRVIEVSVGSQFALHFELESIAANLRLSYSNERQSDVPRFVKGIYEEIEQRRLRTPNDTAAFLLELQSYGATLFRSLLPQQVQRALWQHRDAIESILLLSTETHVPWELVHICDPDTGMLPDARCFLADKGLVRWLHNTQVQPETIAVHAGKVRHIVPDYPAAQWKLPATKRELDFLIARFDSRSVGDAAADLYAMLTGNADFDLLHFAGHGEAQGDDIEDAAILMLGRVAAAQWSPDRAKALVVRSLPQGAGAHARPFVFLNACQVGRAGQVVGTIGGFAAAFLARGAGAFVAPLWAVGDQPAFDFGEALYRGFFHEGLTLSAASTAARRAAATAGDATWLAYAVYGHHDARAQVDGALAPRWG